MGLLGMLAASSKGPGLYVGGTIGQELGDAAVRTVGCLDVGLALVERDPAQDLLQLHVGTRCNHPEALDFARVRIEAEGLDGSAREVKLEDPRGEIVMLHVGPGERGKELVRLNGAAGVVRISFDVNAIAPDVPQAHPAPVRFARESATVPWTAVQL